MGNRVGVRPLHRETFLDKEMPLILVSLPNPLPHHGVQNRGIRVGVRGSRFALPPLHRGLVNGHNVLLTRKDQGRLGVVLITPQPLIDPSPGSWSFGGIVVTDILVVKCIRQGVLRDDIQIPPVEVFVSLEFLRLEAFRKNHVGGDKATWVGSSIHKTVLGEVRQHVPAIHPAEPMVPLAAKRKILPETKGAEQQSQQGRSSRRHG